MSRDLDPRSLDNERPSPNQGSRGGTGGAEPSSQHDPREPFTRDLDLPRGPTRDRVMVRDHVYRLRGSEVRILATAGTFRVVPAAELRECDRDATSRERDLSRLRRLDLVRTMPYVVGRTRTTLVTLTERGRAVLEAARKPAGREPQQTFYSGVVKPQELAHDARLYRAYTETADRLLTRGARLHRVVLESELKSQYQRFLQGSNRRRPDSTGRPDRQTEEVWQWAREHHLPYSDGHVQFPDVRIEYDERDGRHAVEDVEVTTPHYRGAHASAKARAGFTSFRTVGARLGGARLGAASGGRRGGRPFDVRAAEAMLQ